jgi:hypothetical protein
MTTLVVNKSSRIDSRYNKKTALFAHILQLFGMANIFSCSAI